MMRAEVASIVSGQEPEKESMPRVNATVKWSLNQTLIKEMENADFAAVKASVKGISVVIPVQELRDFTGNPYVLTIEEVQEDDLTKSARMAMEGIVRQGGVFLVYAEGRPGDALVHVSFLLPGNADPDEFQLVEIDTQLGILRIPEKSLIVHEDAVSLEGYILNGSMCFLAMK